MLVVGARVQYTRQFLKSIMSPPTSPAWRQEGVVLEIGERFVKLLWDGDEEPSHTKAGVLQVRPRVYVDSSSTAELEYERIYGLNGMNGGK